MHASPEQQETMVSIIREYWNDMLITPLALQRDKSDIVLPALGDLVRRILIKVKQSFNEHLNEEMGTRVDFTDISSPSSAESSPIKGSKKNFSDTSKLIIDSLSNLGIYTRAYSFKGFHQKGRFLVLDPFASELMLNVRRGQNTDTCIFDL